MQENFFVINWNLDVLVNDLWAPEQDLNDLTMANQVLDRFRLGSTGPDQQPSSTEF